MRKHNEHDRVSVEAKLQLIKRLAQETRIEEQKAREHLWPLFPAVYGSTALSITVRLGSIKAIRYSNLRNAQLTANMIELLRKHHIAFVHIDFSPVQPTRRLACLHATQGVKFSQPLGCTAASLSGEGKCHDLAQQACNAKGYSYCKSYFETFHFKEPRTTDMRH